MPSPPTKVWSTSRVAYGESIIDPALGSASPPFHQMQVFRRAFESPSLVEIRRLHHQRVAFPMVTRVPQPFGARSNPGADSRPKGMMRASWIISMKIATARRLHDLKVIVVARREARQRGP